MLTRALFRFSEPMYALLRIFSGLLFFCHGAQKLFGWMGGTVRSEPLMVVAGIVELLGGVAIAAGILTSAAAFLSAGQMAVAYLIAHAPQGLWPIENGGEKALMYFLVFLLIASRGSGLWSVQTILFKNRRAGETP